METSTTPHVPAPQVPVMTIERFSELTGLTPDTIRGQLNQGNLPIIKGVKLSSCVWRAVERVAYPVD
ncbi:hypothetical protein SAMN05878249_0840 [Vreelandella aquamarina]|uniref:Uncharacterized protein n=1 Tax=Vreelandella aquamarina TaxID=77097 RepID=A0A1N6CTJ8_9GAMM|nr:hypothetical protein SAMN05878249_0840 [Halomonas meridiana]SIN67848.1 hypothetical protein SAMN05878438_2273 [Halomonas meridiana]SIN92937.1 hypothetical protein SAMN05878442_0114 [Halomonas meridiana]